MRFPAYLDAAFPCRTFGTVEHKEGEEGCREELRESKEHELQSSILTFVPVFQVEEPEAGSPNQTKGVSESLLQTE